MKTTAVLFVSSVLAAASSANANSALANTTSFTPTNATITTRASIQGDVICTPVIWAWFYNSWSEGPYDCTKNHDTNWWGMLPAYRSGGTEGVHWKYTNDENDGQCLTGWQYYTSDGNGLIATVDRTTFIGDSKRWCALKVYRTGGVKGKQWDYCQCQDA